ncbi:MAG TPA: ABC transporter ATP-binding protein [Candidatus Babeliales bacterium]|nr:ABC transporter ATP-binding protein [Candidatus Babeliales bacterium]
MALIELQNISKTFDLNQTRLAVLKDINLVIDQGEMVAIIGKSGSGKSTLMHILGCLDTPSLGSYLFEGNDITHFNQRELAGIRNQKIGFVFQQFNLLDDLTALENVALPLLYAHADEADALKQAEQILSFMGLSERLHHHPKQLSGGQQQRVAISRALINNPKIILADEPTGNLDSKMSVEVMNLFAQLNQSNKVTIILVTHDEEIAKKAERTIHIHDGMIVNK